MKSKLLVFARLALLACAVITVGFAFAPPSMNAHLFPWDKADHFCAFFALATATFVSFPRTRMIWLIVWLSLAGGLIELVQGLPFVHRDCDLGDWITDNAAIGAVVGVVIAATMRRHLAGGN